MANFINADEIVRELSLRIQSAWGIAAANIFDYSPLSPPTAPGAVIQLDSFSKISGSAQCFSGRQSFSIVGRFAYPASGNLTFTSFKTEKANALLTEIYKGRRFQTSGGTDLGNLYGAPSVSFEEIGEQHARYLEITVEFFIDTHNVTIPTA